VAPWLLALWAVTAPPPIRFSSCSFSSFSPIFQPNARLSLFALRCASWVPLVVSVSRTYLSPGPTRLPPLCRGLRFRFRRFFGLRPRPFCLPFTIRWKRLLIADMYSRRLFLSPGRDPSLTFSTTVIYFLPFFSCDGRDLSSSEEA